ncbi:MAG: hypothetical protein AB1571_00185 [Nanoarchaeota archaeon]
MELGGNISLQGFESTEPATLIVVKKIVGNYAKKISEIKDLKKLTVSRNSSSIEATAQLNDKEIKEKASSDNLFFALSEVLNNLLKKLG